MKRKISSILCICVLFSSFSLNVHASEVNTVSDSAISASSNEPTADNLKNITTAIKSKINIPKSLTNFDYQYNNEGSNSMSFWKLTWSNKDGSTRITVLSDEKANIISFYNYNDNQYLRSKPKYLKDELQLKAEQFIKKAAPSIYKKITLLDSDYNGVYSGQYQYNYQRIEGTIPMPDNSISVSVNYETGEIMSYNSNWLYDVIIPSSKATITEQEATTKIGKNITMTLAYKNAYKTDKNGKTTVRAFLVYQPDKDYISVDAKTGKVYLTREDWIQKDASNATYESAQDTATSDEKSVRGSLTDKEIANIQKLNGLITKEKAIKLVKSEDNLLLDSNATSITAYLYQGSSYDNEKNFVWSINFSDPRSFENSTKYNYRAYASASVDAKTGKILSFHASVPNYYDISEEKWNDVAIKYSLSEGRTTFENFIKKQIPTYYNKTKLSTSDHDYIIAYKEDTPIYGGYRYNYDRVNEGIAYIYNGIDGSVDGVTGKIYRFNYNWDESLTFESKKGAMTSDKAFDYYIAKDGYDLVYEINTIHNIGNVKILPEGTNSHSVKNKVRLVYHPDINPNAISPFTGKQLDENGEIYAGNATYSYTDIASHKSKKAIQLLADMGVGFEGNKFLPNQKITTVEFESLFTKLQYNTEDMNLNKKIKNINRTDAVKSIITLAGLKKVAMLKGIYTTTFKDHKKIPKNDVGYVALAKGLGIVSGTYFNPTSTLTRGEAAQMIVNFLKADIE